MNVSTYPKTSCEEFYRYYQVLIDNNNFENVILLHTMYELRLEPYNLCLVTFEALKDNEIFDFTIIKLELKENFNWPKVFILNLFIKKIGENRWYTEKLW